MINRYTFNQTTWIDIIAPTTEEIRTIFEECEIPAKFTHDLMSMTPQTDTEVASNAIKITLDFPIVKRTDINHPHEVKFIATKTHLITVRFEDMELIHRFSKEFEVLNILKQAGKRATGGHLFVALLSYIYSGLNTKLDYLEGRMQDAERELFNENEKEMLYEISQIGRRLISFKQTMSAHRRALNDLKEEIGSVFSKNYAEKIDPILVSYEHLLARTTALSHTLEILRDTDHALLSAKQNEIMKTLTIMAFITFPLTLVSSIFGMNTTTTPIAGAPYDFWIVIGIMFVVSLCLFGYFKYKHWI